MAERSQFQQQSACVQHCNGASVHRQRDPSMSRNKPPPAVASTGCSGLSLSLLRRGPWERPVVHGDAASASEFLDKMAAMGADNLCRYLNQRMPLKDIAGRNNPGEPVRRTTAGLSSRSGEDDDDDDGLVLKAMGKLESLVLEGLKIQSTEPAAVGRGRRERDEAVGNDGKGCCRVHVVLIQARDPTERYAAVGDSMIGLIEASLDHPESKDTTARLRMQGLHAAGIKLVDGRRMMWSAYLRQCNESRDGGGGGDGCRCTCVRNPNRVIKR